MAQTMAKQNNTVTTDELVVRAQSEAEALARLYDLYYPRVYRFCVVRTAHRQQAEDLTSEVFLQVARSMQRFRGSMEQDFRRWVFAIAANQANNLYRRTLRRARLLDRAAKQLHRADVSAAAEQLGWIGPSCIRPFYDSSPDIRPCWPCVSLRIWITSPSVTLCISVPVQCGSPCTVSSTVYESNVHPNM